MARELRYWMKSKSEESCSDTAIGFCMVVVVLLTVGVLALGIMSRA